ncbi:hypothetical protein L6452_17694 [Arctium lappa]|uniref:Uncharacterized protein n=1 Tax=Arctium lappa TaxID=4217 RepID=A0ACB9C3Z5_ARCLA|nr:hypothetical protein L6452_17694 [Arctium lappa]
MEETYLVGSWPKISSGRAGDDGLCGTLHCDDPKPSPETIWLNFTVKMVGAHDRPIWAMRFSIDGLYLATVDEDKVIHVWEVLEYDVMSM